MDGNVSQQPVLTQMHHLVEAAQAKFVSILPLNFNGQSNQQRSEIMKRHARDPVLCENLIQLSGPPHVLIERSLFERIRNDDPFRAGLIRTLQDLKTAGLLHLPYPEMVVELPDVNGVCEINDTSSFAPRSAWCLFLRSRTAISLRIRALSLKATAKVACFSHRRLGEQSESPLQAWKSLSGQSASTRTQKPTAIYWV